ncbi:MAG: M42 family metallopeptidase [Armatimonadota bacterium]
MEERSKQFLFQLLQTPSPSGYEEPVQEIVRAWAKNYADEVKTDVHGNVIAAINPDGKPRVMLAGHCDQIGLMVQHIDDQGFLYVNPIGGFDMQVLIGQPVVVWTREGPINGIIARKPIHLLTEEERKQIPKFHEIWVDIGAKDGEEAKKKVKIGDIVTFKLEVREMNNGFINSPGIDDKVGAWTVMETLRLLSERKGELKAAVFAVSTVQEEVGLRGAITSAFGIAPDVGIAVDVTFATDHPNTDKRQVGDIKMGAGPVIYRGPNINPVVFRRLVETAEKENIPHQLAGASRPTGTDANAIQISRSGVATGLISIPNRYMHSPVEMVSLSDLENAAKLIAAFVASLNPDDSFIPGS